MEDPSGATASFEYTPVAGSTAELLTTITSTTQAKTHIRYQDGGPSGLVAVASVATTDASNNVLGPVRMFSLNPAGNDDHTYTGYPTYSGGTTDELFAVAQHHVPVHDGDLQLRHPGVAGAAAVSEPADLDAVDVRLAAPVGAA